MANPPPATNSDSAKLIKFKVVVPPNVKPGQVLRIRCPDGTEGDVKVPKGIKPGAFFIFEMPEEALINRGVALAGTTQNDPSIDQKLDYPMAKKRDSVPQKQSAERGQKGKGFLDREIIDRQDFVTALAVGIFIGLSIVGGFLAGVILSTQA
mmetsp:Transcript_15439/g.22756  ORF Transcript_15439/g.22756 Transcript_15439/m.22756 type:complete len:152 (-) Transcript_15439:542-997(-)|eukprot:CAMPEP_0195509216 /NCGR_PEP_ID=MMETSP0794_2-20130614/2216_1 /TAXON_ID=515487 /ORGANISM="Stephanopyxis turris, Strain CCMP 815" /LENGTH=151 /DNA_ID=CAMNT_0040636381 /DNA_START=317 /DNA_END=772 /DNA_ORIENTATION=-